MTTERAAGDPSALTGGYSTEDLERIHELDRALADFTAAMREKLLKNLHKKEGWKQIPVPYIIARMNMEIEELKLALEYETSWNVKMEAADVANFLLFLFHRIDDVGTTREQAERLKEATSQL